MGKKFKSRLGCVRDAQACVYACMCVYVQAHVCVSVCVCLHIFMHKSDCFARVC